MERGWLKKQLENASETVRSLPSFFHPPMKTMYEKRWQYAKRKAERLQQLQQEGYLLIKDNEPVSKLVITDKEIFEQHNENCRSRWFEKNLDYDHGLYWSLDEIDRYLFDDIKVYSPVPIAWDD